VVVVSEDKPLGTVLYQNRRAREAGIRAGMRYSEALSLTHDLRAGVVDQSELSDATETLLKTLYHYSPDIEPCSYDVGVFWLNASGLAALFGSAKQWAQRVVDDLDSRGFYAAVSVGFSRFGTYAGAKSRRRISVFHHPEQEHEFALRAPLWILPLDPAVLHRLELLHIVSIEHFLSLPPEGLRTRFGGHTEELYHTAEGLLSVPLQPERVEEELVAEKGLPFPMGSTDQLLPHVHEILDRVLHQARKEGRHVAEVTLVLHQEDGCPRQETLRPARPSTNARVFRKLIALRLEHTVFDSSVLRIMITGRRVPAGVEQQELFPEHSGRNIEAGNTALALIRAELGNTVVQYARLKDSHIPEQSFEWKPLDQLRPPETNTVSGEPEPPAGNRRVRTLVRRILPTPQPFTPVLYHTGKRQTFTLRDGNEEHAYSSQGGPFVVSSQWWNREITREYYFFHQDDGRVLWVYYDRNEQRWMVQGYLE
jgi:protein ImuB